MNEDQHLANKNHNLLKDADIRVNRSTIDSFIKAPHKSLFPNELLTPINRYPQSPSPFNVPSLLDSPEKFTYLSGKDPIKIGWNLEDKLKALEDELEDSRTAAYTPTKRIVQAKRFDTDENDKEDIAMKGKLTRLRWCAYCSKETVNKTVYRVSARTFWSSVAIFFMGGVCGCFVLPYLSDKCKDPKTLCEKCGRMLK